MHILITADTVGGVWTYARELVTGLVRRGIRVTLVSFGRIPEVGQAAWIDGVRNCDFHPSAFRLEWMQDSAADVETSSEYLLGIIRDSDPDLLHLNQYCYGALPIDIPKIVVAHSDVFGWWNAVHGQDPPDSDWSRWYRSTVKRGLEGASTVIAPSRWMLRELQQHYGRTANTAVIYNGRSPHHFNPHTAKEDLVVSIGRLWDEAKQVSVLTRRDLGCRVTVAGAWQHPDEAQHNPNLTSPEWIDAKGILSCTQVQCLFSRASIYAATSRYEPFGLAPVEAAFSRCALVANDMPSLRELWRETAVYFDANDADSLERAISSLRRDRILRRHYAELAYQRARRLFSADRMIDEYIALYHSLVGERTMAA